MSPIVFAKLHPLRAERLRGRWREGRPDGGPRARRRRPLRVHPAAEGCAAEFSGDAHERHPDIVFTRVQT